MPVPVASVIGVGVFCDADGIPGHELVAAGSLAVGLLLWRLSRSGRLRGLAPLVFAVAIAAVGVLFVLLDTSTAATALFAAAAALVVVDFADALWRSPRHGTRHNVDRWWSDFERDFHTYARHNARRPRQ